MTDEEIKKEVEHLQETGIPRCMSCKKPFVNAIDTITGKVSKYTWRPNCEHNKEIRISIG